MCLENYQSQVSNNKKISLTDEEFHSLLDKHKEWVEYKIKGGNKPDQVCWAKFELTGKNFDNTNLKYANFSLANLEGSSFKGAILRNSNFSNSIVDDVIFDDSDLAYCKFNGARLQSASFKKASLFRVEFHSKNKEVVDLRYVDFTEADIREADLSQVSSLLFSQLAGANLKGTILPKELTWEEYLSSVRTSGSYARKSFPPLMLLSIYLLWAIFESAQTKHKIPLIQMETDLSSLLTMGSLLLAIISGYYRYYLNRLWSMLSVLPDIFPCGTKITQHPDPWFIVEYTKLFLYYFRINWTVTDFLYGMAALFLSYILPLFALFISWYKLIQISNNFLGVFSVVICISVGIVDTIVRLNDSYRYLYRYDLTKIHFLIWLGVFCVLFVIVNMSIQVVIV